MPGAQTESFGVSWEEAYGYVQAVKRGDTIYLSGQLAYDGEQMVAPAPLDDRGHVTDYSNMAEQMRQTYVNASKLLERFGATLADVVEEVLYVLEHGQRVRGRRPSTQGRLRHGATAGRRHHPCDATARVAAQLVEISFIAKV